MRFCSLWQGLIKTDLSGTIICIGDGEGLREFLEVLGKCLYAQKFSLLYGATTASYNQSSLWQEIETVSWSLHIIPADLKDKKNIKEAHRSLLHPTNLNQEQCTWLCFERRENALQQNADIAWIIQKPSLDEWEAFVRHYLPHIHSVLTVPQDLFQAAYFLKSLALTGETGVLSEDPMDGSAWDKFFYLVKNKVPLSLQPLSISDLMHISYCIESLHQKAAMPSKAMRFCPEPLSKILSSKTILMELTRQNMTHYMEMLIAMNLLDQDRANRALSRWISLFAQIVDRAP